MAVVRTGNVERALDALNFFLADVRDGLGPYLAIYLLTEQKWDEASIGVVMSVAALAGIGAGFSARCFRSSSPISRAAPGISISARARLRPPPAGLIGFMAMMPETLRHAPDEVAGAAIKEYGPTPFSREYIDAIRSTC